MRRFIRKHGRIFFALLFALLGLWLYHDLKPNRSYSLEQLYEQTTQMFLKHQTYKKFELSFSPEEYSFDELIRRVSEQDPYLATNLGGSNFIWEPSGDKYKFTMTLDYNATAYQLWRSDRRIRQLCEQLSDLSDYEKIKAIHDYVILYCEYGDSGRFLSDIENGPYWGLFPGKTTCNGYAMIFYRAMQFMDIPVTYETGSEHAWNSILLDGSWYNIDLTWDDVGRGGVRYDYFLKSDEDFAGHHHGCSDATSSYPISGRSAQENYDLFPNYKLQFWGQWAVNLILLLIIIKVAQTVSKKKAEEKLRKKQEEIRALAMMESPDES